MIDIMTERILTPGEAAKLLPSSRPGRRLHIATIHRWFASGRLEYVRLGGRLFTSREALERLIHRESQCLSGKSADRTPAHSSPSTAARKAMRELDLMGL